MKKQDNDSLKDGMEKDDAISQEEEATPIEPDSEDTKKKSGSDDDHSTFESLLDQLRNAFGAGNVHVEGIEVRGPRPRQQKKPSAAKQAETDVLNKIRSFNYTPKDIRNYLDRFVISQEEAKRVLSIAVCDHYNYIRQCLEEPAMNELEHAKHNVLMIGPTGVGKTYIMRCLAKLLGVPFVKVDATKYSETGYVGYDVEDMVRDLIKVANGSVRSAQYGIIYIDEVDKIARDSRIGGKDISGHGVQVNLLKLMEDTEVKVCSQTDMFSQMRFAMHNEDQPSTISTKNILFIVSGAFVKLDEIIQKRLGKSLIGFGHEATGAEQSEAKLLSQVQTCDLVEYGFEPEFIGRLPVRVALDNLAATDLEKILTCVENNFIKQYQEAFKGYGIDLAVQPDAIKTIANQASLEKTGARGLLTILERLFRNFKFELPGLGLKVLNIDAATVNNPQKTLDEILEKTAEINRPQTIEVLKNFSEVYKENYGLSVDFTAEAVNYILHQCIERGTTTKEFVEEKLKDLYLALQLLQRKKKRSVFHITREMVEDQERAIQESLANA